MADNETVAPETAAPEQKPAGVQEYLKAKADLGVCVNAFQGDEITPVNYFALQRRMLDDYVATLPLGFVQAFETILNRADDASKPPAPKVVDSGKQSNNPASGDAPASSGQPDSGTAGTDAAAATQAAAAPATS